MEMKMKTRASIFLVLAILLGILSGCDRKPQMDTDQTGPDNSQAIEEGMRAKYAYKAEYFPVELPDGKRIEYVSNSVITNDYLYFTGSYITGTEEMLDENGQPVLDELGLPVEYEIYEDGLFVMDLGDHTTKVMEGYEPPAVPEGYEGDSYISAMVRAFDGSLWLLEEVYSYTFDLPEDFDSTTDDKWNYVEGTNELLLTQYGENGEQIRRIALNLGEDVYVSRLKMDSEGNFYAFNWEKIIVLDPDGVIKFEIECGDSVGDMFQIGPDEIAVMTYGGEEGNTLKVIDPATGAFKEELPIDNRIYQISMGVDQYRFLWNDQDHVYGYLEETQTSEKLLSWLECDVNANNIEGIYVLDDGKIAALERSYGPTGESSSVNLVMMKQVDRSELPQKQELTLACMYLDWDMRTDIIEFNRSHENVRIIVKDYSEYATDGDYYAGVQKLNTEILSGVIPDLLLSNELPLERYASQGLLADLWPMIDADAELSREDLMTHFFDSLCMDGKLYQITSSFGIRTAACLQQIANGRSSWTTDEVISELKAMGPGAFIFNETNTKADILNTLLSFNLGEYMDWETGSCSFDSPEFINILKFANTFVDEFDWENYDWESAEGDYTRLHNGKQLMLQCYLSSFEDFQFNNAILDGTGVFIGYPSDAGTGNCFTYQPGIAISSVCADKDAAWEFAREVLLAENQYSEENGWMGYAFPSNRIAFEAYAKEAMTPEYQTDPETGEQVEISNHGYSSQDFSCDIYALKQEEYDRFMALYESCSGVYVYDQEVMEQIEEECGAFFAGQKTAEETASLIQNVVGLYMAERS